MKLASRDQQYFILTVISMFALFLSTAMASPDSGLGNAINVSTSDAYALIENLPDMVIIDVRTPEEYQAGHLDGAINLDYYSGGFLGRLKSLDKNSTYLVYCRKGIRGGMALEMMRSLGFKKVYNILGGLALWAEEGRPMKGEVIANPMAASGAAPSVASVP
jgi:rhodanese-related sulfurtransferase